MTEWYYRDAQSRKIGPLSSDEFEARVTAGEIQARTRVWHSGLPDWTTYAALLAQQAGGRCIIAGPLASATPQSSSRGAASSAGASAAKCLPGENRCLTSVATAHPAATPAFELCPGCHEEMPSQDFCELGSRRLCGSCRRHARAARSRLRATRGGEARWLGRFFVRLALVAGAFVAIRILLFEMGGSHSPRAAARPIPEDSVGRPSDLPLAPGSVP